MDFGSGVGFSVEGFQDGELPWPGEFQLIALILGGPLPKRFVAQKGGCERGERNRNLAIMLSCTC